MSVNSKMTDIADAIRNLLDISGTMGLDEMASNISSITKRGAVAGTISTKSEQYIIPAGYHNGNGTVGISSAEQEKLIAENIKNGVTILGVSGTASGDIYAIISVTYPEGSICSCSDGTKTLKARDTSGKALFNVTVGEWTVTATDGNKTKDATVDITTEGQVESVTLRYELVLYRSGDENTAVTGGWTGYGIDPYGDGNWKYTPELTRNAESLRIYIPSGKGGGVACAAQKLDFSGYSTLTLKATTKNIHEAKFCLWSDRPPELRESFDRNAVISYDINNLDNTTIEKTWDITAISSGYVGFGMFSNQAETDIYLVELIAT